MWQAGEGVTDGELTSFVSRLLCARLWMRGSVYTAHILIKCSYSTIRNPKTMIAQFKLDLARAITEQLVEQFNNIASSPLTIEAVQLAKPEPGVYQLFMGDNLVYVGKSDRSLQQRLDRHRKTLTARMNLCIDQISFKGMHLDKNWSPLTTEAHLISYFGDSQWNNSGFGSNDPGRNRDQTELKKNNFDLLYPINVDIVPEVLAGKTTARQLLGKLKANLPYLLRYKQPNEDVNIVVPHEKMTACELIILIASHLKGDWQATALPGRLLLYPELDKSYPGATVLWPTSQELPTR